MNGGQGSIPPICQNCSTSTTPLWRRDESGAVLCNACGLFLKLHGSPRPISLKTDVIKSRNRVKTAGQQGQKRKSIAGEALPVSHHSTPHNQQVPANATSNGLERPTSPFARIDTPSHPLNIAPQHMFDGVSLPEHAFISTTLPHLPLRNHSPASNSSTNDRHLEPPHSYDGLLQANSQLRTRVNELEVINGLYQGHYQRGQPPPPPPPAPQAEMMAPEAEPALGNPLEAFQRRENILLRQIEGLQREVTELRGEEPPAKRTRRSSEPEYPEPPAPPSANGVPS